MAGNREGSQRSKAVILATFGPDAYRKLGSLGGNATHKTRGGFAGSPEKARAAGKIGGTRGSRLGIKGGQGRKQILRRIIKAEIEEAELEVKRQRIKNSIDR
jgi:hypothetical protein